MHTLHTFKVLLLALVLAGGLQYALAAWQGPTALPPGNNAAAPINVSDVTQEKDGGFISWAGGIFSGNGVWANQYCDLNGENCADGGDVGGSNTQWFDPPVSIVNHDNPSGAWHTKTISQVPANSMVLLGVDIEAGNKSPDDVRLYVRKRGSSFNRPFFGEDNNQRSTSHTHWGQIWVQVDENSQMEYRAISSGHGISNLNLYLIGYIE